MEFTVNLPQLDGVGGILRLNCPGYGPNKYVPGLEADCQWHTDRPVTGTPEEQAAEIARRRDVIAAAVAEIVDDAGNLAFVYDGSADDHLRIYSLDRCPSDLVGRYLANRAPTEYNWALLDLRKEAGPDLVTYYDDETPICKREFSRSVDEDEVLTTTETPSWARNDGSWLAGPSKVQVYRTKEQVDKVTAARREKAYDRLRQEFTAYNKQRLRDQLLTPTEMVTWLRSEECENVLALLRLLAFESAILAIDDMVGVGATEDFKTVWVAKLTAEL